jgi:hypothetical protein
MHAAETSCSRRTWDGGVATTSEQAVAKLSSMEAAMHGKISLDPVYYVGRIIAADHGSLGCQRCVGGFDSR